LVVLAIVFLIALQVSNASAQTAIYTVTVTVQGVPATLSTKIYVDYVQNGTLAGGQSRTFTFTPGSIAHVITVDIYVPGPAGSAGSRYYVKDISWFFNTAATHVFSYSAQYYLTVKTSYGAAKGEGWYDTGSSVQPALNAGEILESPGINHVFAGWGADASGTGLTSNPILMDKPKNATANWKTRFLLTVESDPTNVTSLHGTGWFDAGSQATFSAPAVAPVNSNSRLRFDHWSGAFAGQSSSGSVTMDRPKVVQAHYLVQYLLTIHYDPQSIPHSYNETSWQDANTDVPLGPARPTIDLSSVERLRFVGWVENGNSLPGASLDIRMDKSHELTLSYITQYYVDVRSAYGMVSGAGWYDKGAVARIIVSETAGYWPITYTLSDWHVTPSTSSLTSDNGFWTLTVDRPYVVEAVWNFDMFPILALLGGSALAVIAVVGIAIAYKRGMLNRGLGKMRTSRTGGTLQGKLQTCGGCGNRILGGATFCQKCGTPVAATERPTSEGRVYDYIVKHEGVISLSRASQELGLSVEEIKKVTENLKKEGRLT
jgi:hypothetical protein